MAMKKSHETTALHCKQGMSSDKRKATPYITRHLLSLVGHPRFSRDNLWIDTRCRFRNQHGCVALTWAASMGHLTQLPREFLYGHLITLSFSRSLPALRRPSRTLILRPIFTPTKLWRPAILVRETCGEVLDRCNITQGWDISKTW